MIEYILADGTPIGVEPENEEQFKLDNPTAKLKSSKPGKQESSTNEENVDVEQIDGTSQSQDNQQDKDTELASGDGSSEQLETNKLDLKNKYKNIYGFDPGEEMSLEDLKFYIDNPFATKPEPKDDDSEQVIDEPKFKVGATGPYYEGGDGNIIQEKDLNIDQKNNLKSYINEEKIKSAKLAKQHKKVYASNEWWVSATNKMKKLEEKNKNNPNWDKWKDQEWKTAWDYRKSIEENPDNNVKSFYEYKKDPDGTFYTLSEKNKKIKVLPEVQSQLQEIDNKYKSEEEKNKEERIKLMTEMHKKRGEAAITHGDIFTGGPLEEGGISIWKYNMKKGQEILEEKLGTEDYTYEKVRGNWLGLGHTDTGWESHSVKITSKRDPSESVILDFGIGKKDFKKYRYGSARKTKDHARYTQQEIDNNKKALTNFLANTAYGDEEFLEKQEKETEKREAKYKSDIIKIHGDVDFEEIDKDITEKAGMVYTTDAKGNIVKKRSLGKADILFQPYTQAFAPRGAKPGDTDGIYSKEKLFFDGTREYGPPVDPSYPQGDVIRAARPGSRVKSKYEGPRKLTLPYSDELTQALEKLKEQHEDNPNYTIDTKDGPKKLKDLGIDAYVGGSVVSRHPDNRESYPGINDHLAKEKGYMELVNIPEIKNLALDLVIKNTQDKEMAKAIDKWAEDLSSEDDAYAKLAAIEVSAGLKKDLIKYDTMKTQVFWRDEELFGTVEEPKGEYKKAIETHEDFMDPDYIFPIKEGDEVLNVTMEDPKTKKKFTKQMSKNDYDSWMNSINFVKCKNENYQNNFEDEWDRLSNKLKKPENRLAEYWNVVEKDYNWFNKISSNVGGGIADAYWNIHFSANKVIATVADAVSIYPKVAMGNSVLEGDQSAYNKRINQRMVNYKDWRKHQRTYSLQHKHIAFEDKSDAPLEFILQEVTTNVPTFLAIGTSFWNPYAGIGLLTGMSHGDQMGRMYQNDFRIRELNRMLEDGTINKHKYHEMFKAEGLKKETSATNKWLTGLGYATFEAVPEFFVSRFLISRAFTRYKKLKGDLKTKSPWTTIEGFKQRSTEAIKTLPKSTPKIAESMLAERYSEQFTQIGQNMVTGNPDIMEGVDHAGWSGGMFGALFESAPTIKGFVSKFYSPPSIIKKYNEFGKKIERYEHLLRVAEYNAAKNQLKKEGIQNPTSTQVEQAISDGKGNSATTDNIVNQITELMQEQQTIVADQTSRLNQVHKDYAEDYHDLKKQELDLKKKIQEINDNPDLSDQEKAFILEGDPVTESPGLMDQLNGVEAAMERMGNSNLFKSSRFTNFLNSITIFGRGKKNTEKKERRDKLFNDAELSLIEKGNQNPSEQQIRNEAEYLYNVEEINKDYKAKRKGKKFLGEFANLQTVEDAIKWIEGREDLSESQKKKLIEGAKNGTLYGSNIETSKPKYEIKDGKQVLVEEGKHLAFQIVENMAKNGRLETRTHELGHTALTRIIGQNPEAFRDIAEQLIEHVDSIDPDLGLLLRQRTAGMPVDEIITNFMELVGSKKILKKHEGLGSMIANAFTKKANIPYNFEGEIDAVTFITKLAEKIKDGSLTLKDIKAAEKSKVVKEAQEANEWIDNVNEQYGGTIDDNIKFSIDASSDINDAAKGAYENDGGNKLWKDFGSKDFIDNLIKEDSLGNLIMSVVTDERIMKGPQAVKDQFKNDVYNELSSHIKNYKPEQNAKYERDFPGESTGLFGWINSQLKNKVLNVQQRPEYMVDELRQARDIDARTEEGRPIYQEASQELSPEEILIAKEEAKRNQNTQETLNNLIPLILKPKTKKQKEEATQLEEEFKQALVTAFGTKLPEVTNDKLRTELKKIIADKLTDKIRKIFGTESSYNNFLKNDLPALIDYVDIDDLNQMEKQAGGKRFPGGRKIFQTQKRITKKGDIIALQDAGLIPKRFNKYSQGYNLKTRLKPTGKELLAFFRGIDSQKILGYKPGDSAFGPRKTSLAKNLASEIGLRHANSVANDLIKSGKLGQVEQVQNRQLKDNHLAELNVTLRNDMKMSEKASKDAIKNIETVFDLIEDGGIEAILDPNGDIVDGLPEISGYSISSILDAYNQNIILEEESIRFKQGIFKSDKFSQETKDALRKQGNLRYADLTGLHEDASVIAKALGSDIMNILGYEILGYKNRFMDPAKEKKYPKWKDLSKQEQSVLIKKSKTDEKGFMLDDNGNRVPGEYYIPLQNLIKNVKSQDLPSDLTLEDIRLKNIMISGSIYKKINDILAIPSKEIKLQKLKELAPEIEKANIANIILAKHVAKRVIELARKGPQNGGISTLSAINILQAQTSIVQGFRALSRTDLIDVREGSQALYIDKKGNYTNNKGVLKTGGKFNTNHPQLKEAISYYKSKKGKKNALSQMKPKGEHLKANSNTMLEIAELINSPELDLDTQLDVIFSNHSQLFTSDYGADMIDDGPGGKTSTAEFNRIKHLKPKDQANLISADGKSYQEVLFERTRAQAIANLMADASVKNSKQAERGDAFSNVIKFSQAGTTQGASIFDFDDTLGFTKSGVRVTMPNPDGTPKPKRKVIFLAGGAGSGKGNVISKLGLENSGFKIVNSDISLEWLKKNSGLPADMRDLTKEQRSTLGKLGHQARKIARNKMMKYQGEGNGVVVDGTGGSMKQMQKLVDEFKAKGYDVSMLFVDTSLEVALDRNKKRKERSLLDVIVRRNHEAVQGNKDGFKILFGGRFMEVNTDNITMDSPMPSKLVTQMNDFVSGYEKRRIDAEEFAEQGDAILEQGGEFDFTEFNDVIDGTPGPLLDKAKQRIEKFGNKDVFILTARTPQAAGPIQQFLKSQGLDIPIKNITGLANSSPNAKAEWVLQKYAEGYNDLYFVDDAIQNVEAVKEVLDQLDVKSNVVQAKMKFSQKASRDFNNMMERKKGVDSKKIFSYAEARKKGAEFKLGRFLKSLYIPPSAEDFKGLMYYFLGEGKQGNADLEFFANNLFKPFAKGIKDWNTYKQNMVDDYNALKKQFPKVKLNKKIPGTDFTVDTAVRVYLWDKAGFDIPGISDQLKKQLIDYVNKNPDAKSFAEGLSKITKRKEGYIKPNENWMVETIPSDMRNIVDKIGRKEFLEEWINNKDIIFSKENMNKIRALYGDNFAEALENILYRMENGNNKTYGKDKVVSRFTEWINGSVGAIMFFNMRSALLQTISTVNFINWSDNNLFKAATAFANQPQFWKDFVTLFNSDQLKQRRKGLQTDVSASELTKSFTEGKATPRAVINYLLQKGFTPTQIADSFAIAFGGASFYRNRFNKYKKEGMSDKQAHEQAMLDFQEVAEETQQSSREDLVSQQQAGPLGRIVLAFQNVTMQMGRLTKKAMSDLRHGRGDWKTNVSKILYYGMVQNIVFASLQTALAFTMWGDEEEEIKDDTQRALNQALDSFLRGTGLYGALVSTLKNTIIQWDAQSKKGFGQQDVSKLALEVINLSPPIGSKVRKIVSAFKTEQYNKGVGKELGWRIENPEVQKWASIIEAATNIPLARIVNKSNNLEEAITGNHEMWQRIAMALGWNRWDLGVKDEELEAAKTKVKTKRKEEKKKLREEKKAEEKIEKEKIKKEEKEKEEERKKKEGIKTVRCSGRNSAGKRCGLTTETKAKKWKCFHHAAFKDGGDRDGDGVKEYQCTGRTKSGKRCKNKGEYTGKKKRCYAHQ